MGAWRGFRIGLGVVAVAALLVAPAGASAAFPGKNGKIAFVCPKGPYLITHPNEEICTVTPGAAPVRLTTNAFSDRNPDFSADGKRIVFVRLFGKPGKALGDIFVINANGTGLKRLTHTASVSELDPAWSPSGKQIAYTKGLVGENAKIAVMRVSNGKVLRTLGPGDQPNWSPSGRKIAFAKRDHLWSLNDYAVGEYSIYTMNAANGSSRTRLTSVTTYANGDPCPPPNEGCPEHSGNPDWSPNGGTIAWEIYDSKLQSGYVYRMTAGGGTKTLTIPFGSVGGGCPQHPAFSPDGSEIVFSDGLYCDTGGNPAKIYIRTVLGGAPVKVADGFEPDWGRKP
jgi:Tol biopolymer transport system component